jgi:hypothetical protein
MDRSFEFPDPWEFRLRDIALQMARWLSSKIPDFDCPGLAMDWAAFAGAVSSEHSVASEIADTVDVWLARGLDFNDPWRNRTTDNLPQTMAMYRRHGMRVADALLPQP